MIKLSKTEYLGTEGLSRPVDNFPDGYDMKYLNGLVVCVFRVHTVDEDPADNELPSKESRGREIYLPITIAAGSILLVAIVASCWCCRRRKGGGLRNKVLLNYIMECQVINNKQ